MAAHSKFTKHIEESQLGVREVEVFAEGQRGDLNGRYFPMILQSTASFEHAANPVLGTAQPDLHTKIRQKNPIPHSYNKIHLEGFHSLI